MSVDLPSSTEPAVANRSISAIRNSPLSLAVFHAGLADAVVGPGGAPLGDARGGHLDDHLVDRRRGRLDRAGAGRVADGAEAHGGLERLFAVDHRHVGRDRQQHAVTPEHLAPVGVVDVRDGDALLGDVLPDVELGPVADREHADVLALAVPAVVEAPQLRALVLRVPLAELVAEAEDALLGPRLLLVAAGAAEHGVEAVLLDGVQQRDRLQAVAARERAGLLDHPARRRSTPAPRRPRGERRARRPERHGTRAPRRSCARCRCA